MYVVHPNCWTKNLTIGVFYMTKYNYELKKQVVKSYLNGEGGYIFISKKYSIPSHVLVERWVNQIFYLTNKQLSFYKIELI